MRYWVLDKRSMECFGFSKGKIPHTQYDICIKNKLWYWEVNVNLWHYVIVSQFSILLFICEIITAITRIKPEKFDAVHKKGKHKMCDSSHMPLLIWELCDFYVATEHMGPSYRPGLFWDNAQNIKKIKGNTNVVKVVYPNVSLQFSGIGYHWKVC